MNKKTVVLILIVPLLLGSIIWLYLKISTGSTARLLQTEWSSSGNCYINAYAPRFASNGAAGRLVALFSSQYFYRVYSKDGSLIRSSEWMVWQHETGGDIAPQWINGNVLYPGVHGWEGWRLPECG